MGLFRALLYPIQRACLCGELCNICSGHVVCKHFPRVMMGAILLANPSQVVAIEHRNSTRRISHSVVQPNTLAPVGGASQPRPEHVGHGRHSGKCRTK